MVPLWLGLAAGFMSCFENPQATGTIGSCRHQEDEANTVANGCEEFHRRFGSRDEARDSCAANRGEWSNDPCDRVTACGCCVRQRSTETSTLCDYPTQWLPRSDDVLRANCAETKTGKEYGDTWEDNPDVSCN